MTDKKESENVEKETKTTPSKEDEELSALLDSALEDFSKESKKSDDGKNSSQLNTTEEKRPEPPTSLWNDEFLQQTTARFEENIQALFSPNAFGTFSAEQLGENIQRLAEAATQTAGFDSSPDLEFSGIIAQTLKNLTDNTESIQNQLSADNLMSMLGTLGTMTEPNGDPSSFYPVMFSMMQNLLSKDVLHPALSGLVEKYPEWLENNKAKLSSDEFQLYTNQFKLMKETCDELEKERPNDSQEVKNARFEKVMSLMQKIQDTGPPPPELAGVFEPILRLDDYGNPMLPPDFPQNQCNIM